jgi:Ser/Thr protein kinase RdoA (MazF antagonist)
MAALADAGVPVPVAVLTTQGERWVVSNGDVYELYFLLRGRPHDPSSLAQVEAAGEALGRFHEALVEAQIEGHKPVERLFAPGPSREGLLWAMHRLREDEACALPDSMPGQGSDDPGDSIADCRAAHDMIGYLLFVAESVAEELPDELYWSLPMAIVHGDYHSGNLLFDGDRVAGIFDFDWVSHQPRMADITDGLIFFAGRRDSPLDPADIRSLTQPFTLDWPRMRRFMAGYQRVLRVEEDELAALPAFIRARWLYMRVDAMRRKVPDAEKLEFLLSGVLRPLRWVEQEEERLKAGAWA